MKMRRYQNAADLYRAQKALMRWIQQAGPCNYLHKGDIGHGLFNGCYGYDPARMFRYWLDAADELVAFAIFYPHKQFFDLQIAPALHQTDRHIELFDFCESETLKLAEELGKPLKQIDVDVDDCDAAQGAFITARGYQRATHSFTLTRHDLQALPSAALPSGFHFHQATAADAAQLADVHNHSFTNKWDAESYGAVFRAPHLEYEVVVVAPDGRFAAFTNLWVDEVNRSLLFEPVGTHSDFRRRGLGKALMSHALRRMQAERGIECAYVIHEPPAKNPASSALYASVGFKPLYDIYQYKKTL